jgi:UDP-glucose 4-epimerase
MRVLVTGGAGFIGSHLTDALLARGDEVTVVDDLSRGRIGRLDDRIILHKVSISGVEPLISVVASATPELIIHLAAQIDVRVSVDTPTPDAQVNVLGTVNILQAARNVGARIVFASSGGAIYGRDAPIPSPEEVLPQPESPYGMAKYCAEQYIGLYNRLHGTRHSIMRLANVYGPRQDPGGDAGVIPIFCQAALANRDLTVYGNGTQTRDYAYVGDVVEAFLAAAGVDQPGIWNIGTGLEISVLDLVQIIAKVAGRPLRPKFSPARRGELQCSVLSVSKAFRDLGWRAPTRLAEGVGSVCRWIEAGLPDRAAC